MDAIMQLENARVVIPSSSPSMVSFFWFACCNKNFKIQHPDYKCQWNKKSLGGIAECIPRNAQRKI
jgi:hypothetical protein